MGGATIFHPSFNEYFVGDDGGFIQYAQRLRSQRHVRGFPSSVVRRRGARVHAGVSVPRDVRVVRGAGVTGSCGIRFIQDYDVTGDDKWEAFGTAHPPVAAGFCHYEGDRRLNVARHQAIDWVGHALLKWYLCRYSSYERFQVEWLKL